MTYETPGAEALDYYPCRYGRSKLLFRGPRRRLEGEYFAVLGGTETYGKYLAEPYPAKLEKALGRPVVNFGYLNAGPDVYVSEPVVIEACDKARVTVIQLMGAQNMSNRFYAVHPRRNDRFLRASTLMKTVFREIDFAEFHFTRHMLLALRQRTPEKFELVAQELRAAWVARMKLLLEKIEGKTVLLWLDDPHAEGADPLGPEPLLVEAGMVEALRPLADEIVHVKPSAAACSSGTAGMLFPPLEEPVAARMPGPLVHSEIAAALAPVLERLA